MDLAYGPEYETFRAEVKAFLEGAWPPRGAGAELSRREQVAQFRREAIDRGIPAPVITAALMRRFASQGRDDFAARVLASMRSRFGGHPVSRAKP